MKKNLLVFAFIFSFLSTNAQDFKDKFPNLKKNTISLNLLGITPIIGITYERILSEKLSVEVGVGMPSLGLGMKYFPFNLKEKKLIFHTGFSATYFEGSFYGYEESDGERSILEEDGLLLYVPIGMSYYGKTLSLGIDVGPALGDALYEPEFTAYFGFKLGVRF